MPKVPPKILTKTADAGPRNMPERMPRPLKYPPAVQGPQGMGPVTEQPPRPRTSVNVRTLPKPAPKQLGPGSSGGPKLGLPSQASPKAIELPSTSDTYKKSLITPDDRPALKNLSSQSKLIRTQSANVARTAHVPPTPKPTSTGKQLIVRPPSAATVTEGVKEGYSQRVGEALQKGGNVKPPSAAAVASDTAEEAGKATVRTGVARQLARKVGIAGTAATVGSIAVPAAFQALAARGGPGTENRDTVKMLKNQYGLSTAHPKLRFQDVTSWLTTDDKLIPKSDPNQLKVFDDEGNEYSGNLTEAAKARIKKVKLPRIAPPGFGSK